MYPGGKGTCYHKIINLIPPHDTYIESHLGGGAVMLNKRPARLNIGIDLDIDALKDFAAASPELAIPAHNTAAVIAKNSDGYRQTPSELAMVANIAKTSEVGSTVKNGDAPGRIVETGEVVHIAKNDEHRCKLFLICADSVEWLESYQFTGNEFVYCDPPYVMESRSSQRPIYKYEYSDSDHEKLLSVLIKLNCNVMVSGYWSELYGDMLNSWHTINFELMTRGGTLATEYLWMNYPEPNKLHDYQYLGDNFRERERIKRKKNRWVNRLQKMDSLERKAILWAIRDAGIEV